MLENLKGVKTAKFVVEQLKEKAQLSELSKRTSAEAEKAVTWVVDKLIKAVDEPVSEEVRAEIIAHTLSQNPRELPKSLQGSLNLSGLKEIKNLKTELGKIRHDVANSLVTSAKERLAARATVTSNTNAVSQ